MAQLPYYSGTTSNHDSYYASGNSVSTTAPGGYSALLTNRALAVETIDVEIETIDADIELDVELAGLEIPIELDVELAGLKIPIELDVQVEPNPNPPIPPEIQVIPDIIVPPRWILRPRAYVMIWFNNEWRYLGTATNFTCGASRTNLIGSFSVNIALANEWNPRTTEHKGWLDPDLSTYIRIFYSDGSAFRLNKTERDYIRIWEGLVTKKPESYQYGSGNNINLSGGSRAITMQKYVPDDVENFRGNSKDLFREFLNPFDRDFASVSLNYTERYDPNKIRSETIGYGNTLTAIQDIAKIIGPNAFIYIDQVTNSFVITDIQLSNLTTDTTDYELTDGKNTSSRTESYMLNLNENTDSDQIITKVFISGEPLPTTEIDDSGEIPITVSNVEYPLPENEPTTEQEQYGINKLSISSGLIRDLDIAQQLAEDYYDAYIEFYRNTFDCNIILEKNMHVGQSVTINSEFATISNKVGIIDSYTHNYQAEGAVTTNIKGFHES